MFLPTGTGPRITGGFFCFTTPDITVLTYTNFSRGVVIPAVDSLSPPAAISERVYRQPAEGLF
jgi:hypothetical protein